MVGYCPRCGTARSGSLPICPGCGFDLRTLDGAMSTAPPVGVVPAVPASGSARKASIRGALALCAVLATVIVGGAALLAATRGPGAPTLAPFASHPSTSLVPIYSAGPTYHCPTVTSWGTPEPGAANFEWTLWWDKCWEETRTGQAPATPTYTPLPWGP